MLNLGRVPRNTTDCLNLEANLSQKIQFWASPRNTTVSADLLPKPRTQDGDARCNGKIRSSSFLFVSAKVYLLKQGISSIKHTDSKLGFMEPQSKKG